VRPRAPAVPDQFLVVRACVQQGVGQDGEPGRVQRPLGQPAVVVSGLGDAADGALVPGEDVGWERRFDPSASRNKAR